MRDAHPLEQDIGIQWYATETAGIGGRLKAQASDFRVGELEGITLQSVAADANAYPHLVIRATLTEWDTFAFAERLAREVGQTREAVDWAGTKDKSAVTRQLFSIADIGPNDIPEIPGAEIECVGRFGRSLTFGDLRGNTFDIRVRDSTAPERHHQITAELRSFGGGHVAFPNFFGQQRFGSRRAVTHEVGLAILAGDWEGAVMQYLGAPTDREPPESRRARQYLEETRNWAGGLERMPTHLLHERRLLASLQDADRTNAASYREALSRLPAQLRQLFVHAAQSYVFNRIVSERGERGFPFTEAMAGDTVCFAVADDDLGAIPDPHRRQRVTPDRVRSVNRHMRNGRAFLTAPLVGTDTEIETGEPGDITASILEELDLTPSAFDLPQPYDSSGTVRPMTIPTCPEVDPEPLRFSFALPSGAYATVLLREYLKVSPVAMT